ncbi:hypothetical protein ABIF66_006954 [Bradyrhizobium japonicum]
MMERDRIVTWVREHGLHDDWLLDLYYHLTRQGIPPDAAIEAMEHFVDDAIAIKTKSAWTAT